MHAVTQSLIAHEKGQFCVTRLDQESLDTIAGEIASLGTVVRQIDARACLRTQHLFDEFAWTLGFPDYFGRNWAAFDECIGDREFKPRGPTLLIVQHFDRLLTLANGRARDIMLSIFSRLPLGQADSNYMHFPESDFPPFWMIVNYQHPDARKRLHSEMASWTFFDEAV